MHGVWLKRSAGLKPSEIVDLGDGFFALARSYQVEAGPDLPGEPPLELLLTVVIEDGRPVIDEMHVKRVEGAPGISVALLRRLPLRFLLAKMPPLAVQTVGPGHAVSVTEKGAERLQRIWHRGPGGRRRSADDVSSRLAEVAAIYRGALLAAKPPTKAVAEGLSVSQSYAGKLVMQARTKGLLGPTTKGRAGEIRNADADPEEER